MNTHKLFKKSRLALAIGASSLLIAAPQFGFAQADADADITVEEQAAEVQYEEAPTQVQAEQQQMEVEVETGEPRVSVEQPEPKVTVEQPEPEISVEQTEPQVVVKDAEPHVEVTQAEPEVTVKSAEPRVEIVNKDADGEIKQEQQQAQSNQEIPAVSLMQAQLGDLRDTAVTNSAGDELGSVQDIVVSRDGERTGFVISVGGVLGVADKRVFIPADEAQLQGDSIVWQTAQNQEQIEASANYDPDKFYSVAEKDGSLEQAQQAVADAN